MVNENNKKKVIIVTMIAVLLLLVVVISATYAFFTTNVINNSEDTDISITTENKKDISITGGVANYKLHLAVSDMSTSKVGNVYYGTTSDSKNYETDQETGTIAIGNIDTQSLVDNYTCNATLNIELSGDMKDKLKTNDFVLVISQGETTKSFDLSENLTNSTFNFSLKSIEPIKSYLKFTNQETDQSGLANKTLNANVSITDFKCEIEKNAFVVLKKYAKGETGVKTLQDEAVNGLYRYYGNDEEVTNNFICLGPEGNTCATDEDKKNYLYRIIGVTDGSNNQSSYGLEAGYLKVIKAFQLPESQRWHSSGAGDIDWDEASVQKYLNETFYDTIEQRIKDKIPSVKWYKGNVTYSCDNPRICPPEEEVEPVTNNSYSIGLMYASDFYHSNQYDKEDILDESYNWLYAPNGASISPSTSDDEWTMTRYGLDSFNTNCSWYMGMWNGPLSMSYNEHHGVGSLLPIRPVFYLSPDINLLGRGTENNPFIISEG